MSPLKFKQQLSALAPATLSVLGFFAEGAASEPSAGTSPLRMAKGANMPPAVTRFRRAFGPDCTAHRLRFATAGPNRGLPGEQEPVHAGAC
jgi:hypothetical protein